MDENLNTEQSEQKEQPAVDPFTERAMELGWRPQEEWTGAPEDFIDAKEFVRRQPLFEKIDHQSKELRALKQAFDAFKTHHSKVKEAEYNRALAALKAEKRRALSDGETERALVIEDKMEEIQEQKTQFEQEAASVPETDAATLRPEFVRWTQENTWYNSDRAMTAYADKLGIELRNEGYSPPEILERVSREVKKEFAHKFKNPARERAGSVEGGSRMQSNAEPEFKMSDDERRIMNRMLAAGNLGITKEQYIAELKSMKERG
jgi:hypothetical protein